ncbi:fibronectin type 3 and ankyrin repeat domains protein 1-like [Oscarella lobularis]|uniref:fibronectin type 3 and ankyrin repeat domains protein 1-like n=1 Tax=Oscarella lobularis TaxID=121494 RepID=UPI0033133809
MSNGRPNGGSPLLQRSPQQPDPPFVGTVTHHTIELYWNSNDPPRRQPSPSSSRLQKQIRYTVEEESMSVTTAGRKRIVYSGIFEWCTVSDGLEPQSQYRYRLQVTNEHGSSEFSQPIIVSTAKRPLSGEDLHKAVLNWDMETVKKVVSAGNVPIDVPDKYGSSALMSVAQKGYKSVAKLLLENGADVNYTSGSGKTSLMIACYHGHLNVVQLLKEHGARYDVRDKGGSMALHWAVDGGQEDMVAYLIRDRVPVDERDGAGWTPLIRTAAVTGHVGIARILLAFDADIDAKDSDGRTALMIASLNGHKDLVSFLVEKGADRRVQSKYGASASDFAESFGRDGVLNVLTPPPPPSSHHK